MRNKIIAFSIVVAGCFMSSCDNLVEVEPRNQIPAEAALTDVRSYQAVLISAYDRVQSFNYWGRDMALLGDALTDNIYTNPSLAGGRYVSANRNARGAHFNIWNTAYTAINELNIILASIDDLAVTTDADVTLKSRIKGEALALRGMIYFDLARIYGYEPNQVNSAGNGFNKSVILRTEPTIGAEDADLKARATVEEVYAQIESDFNAAIPLLEGTSNVFRMNQGAAYALLGKVYLYEAKYSQSVAAFDSAMATGVAELAEDYVDAFSSVPHPGSFFELSFNATTEMVGVTGSNNSLFSYSNPTRTNPEGLTTFGGQTASAELVSLFEEGDERLEMFYNSRNETWAYKYNSSNGDYTDNVKIIRYADVMLMKAEALAMLGQFDAAAEIVMELRATRSASVDTVPTDASIIDFIKVERQRELFFEGHRWFDLKRWGMGITKPARTAVGIISPTDYRILAPIPNAEVILNPSLEQNPEY